MKQSVWSSFCSVTGQIHALLRSFFTLLSLSLVFLTLHRWALVTKPKQVSTLGDRMTDKDDCKECDDESRACYRSWTMRASYLRQDRCELQYAVKELARRMQQPNAKNVQALKHLVRFLKGSPRRWVVCCRQAEHQVVGFF